MFSIYNKGSVGFRSTADNLYNLKHVDKVSEIDLKPEEGFIQDFTNAQKEQKQNQNLDQSAINKYKKMANIDTSEPVYHVQDIMTKDCIIVDNNSTIEEAYEILKDNKVSQLPVISFGKKIMGLINKKIILNLIMDDIENSENIIQKKIDDIYLPELITVDPVSDIRRVAKVMLDFKLDAIPVVNEEDILLGIVSKTNIIKAISSLPRLQLWS
ncbi:CBS domain-containing protein [Poseidonibacter ostreae]|jgi:acetoin utilization protein AcuB|uniref:CBS domain-containing protein n=1 Tax=Poseidonibacter ostreae TaxID=2654171 RepID=A0A6L4WTG0_9BACT|nr:CBS domain-containing protein [Poseidonibacter ostreae]KAB7887062.1 CBS domain-containing protein [Poseidonibacter ostreae]KAB7889214.1 CBS domain-containing protein [Poseidonibacter ostreae]KAB7891585.1 CBS domain-containing protein [Poseidonibacter ostreae]MAC84095.1 CBS domain-containing protein [Arcobacter sp.]|tara:strand:- start:6203 stop:6841 length:639 start_codon:yes stop_codon:yes gene_type:complete